MTLKRILMVIMTVCFAGISQAKLALHWKLDEMTGPTAVDETGSHYGTESGSVTWGSADMDIYAVQWYTEAMDAAGVQWLFNLPVRRFLPAVLTIQPWLTNSPMCLWILF